MSKKTKELQTLLTFLVDSTKGYKEAADKASQERHKKLFTDLSAERHQFALDLQEFLTRHSIDAELEGSSVAAAHRAIMGLKDMLDGDSDAGIMGSIVTGESELLACYRDAMEDVDYDTEILKTLQQQYKKIEAHIDLIDAKKSAA